MKENLTFQTFDKAAIKAQIADRFLQIRRNLYGDNNRLMASEIGEDEKIVSSICNKTRALGITTLLKLLLANPDIDANWLLVGRRYTPKPYEINEDDLFSLVASEDASEPYGSKNTPSSVRTLFQKQQETINHLSATVDRLTSDK